jgi:hypothetical protein
MNSDAWMSAGKREVRFYLDETEHPLSEYIAEWIEWRDDCKVIHRTLRSFVPADSDPMAVRCRLIEMNGADECPVWFMGALRHLLDHASRERRPDWRMAQFGNAQESGGK